MPWKDQQKWSSTCLKILTSHLELVLKIDDPCVQWKRCTNCFYLYLPLCSTHHLTNLLAWCYGHYWICSGAERAHVRVSNSQRERRGKVVVFARPLPEHRQRQLPQWSRHLTPEDETGWPRSGCLRPQCRSQLRQQRLQKHTQKGNDFLFIWFQFYLTKILVTIRFWPKLGLDLKVD